MKKRSAQITSSIGSHLKYSARAFTRVPFPHLEAFFMRGNLIGLKLDARVNYLVAPAIAITLTRGGGACIGEIKVTH